jgi:hypothetical protein
MNLATVPSRKFFLDQPSAYREADLLEIEDFATRRQCAAIVGEYEQLHAAGKAATVGVPIWDGAVIYHKDFPHGFAYSALMDIRWRATRMVSDRAGRRLACDATVCVRWTGQELTPHYDCKQLDGRPNDTAWREWSAVLYLNDDYHGGELVMPHAGLVYKPRAGSLVVFRADALHGVRACSDGMRYTCAMWFTSDMDRGDRT